MPSIFGVFFKYLVRILRIIFPRWMAQFAINRLIGQERHARHILIPCGPGSPLDVRKRDIQLKLHLNFRLTILPPN
jgi:hypothetical protein